MLGLSCGTQDLHCGVRDLLVAAWGLLSCGMWTLSCGMHVGSSSPGVEPGAPALGAWSLTYWTTREVPILVIFVFFLLGWSSWKVCQFCWYFLIINFWFQWFFFYISLFHFIDFLPSLICSSVFLFLNVKAYVFDLRSSFVIQVLWL